MQLNRDWERASVEWDLENGNNLHVDLLITHAHTCTCTMYMYMYVYMHTCITAKSIVLLLAVSGRILSVISLSQSDTRFNLYRSTQENLSYIHDCTCTCTSLLMLVHMYLCNSQLTSSAGLGQTKPKASPG